MFTAHKDKIFQEIRAISPRDLSIVYYLQYPGQFQYIDTLTAVSPKWISSHFFSYKGSTIEITGVDFEDNDYSLSYIVHSGFHPEASKHNEVQNELDYLLHRNPREDYRSLISYLSQLSNFGMAAEVQLPTLLDNFNFYLFHKGSCTLTITETTSDCLASAYSKSKQEIKRVFGSLDRLLRLH